MWSENFVWREHEREKNGTVYRFIEYNHNDSNGTIHNMNNKVQMMRKWIEETTGDEIKIWIFITATNSEN